MKASYTVILFVLTTMNAWSEDTIKVSLAKSGNYHVNNGTVIIFSDYVPNRADTVRFSPDGTGQIRHLTSNNFAFLNKDFGLQLTIRSNKLVELEQSISLPANLHVGTAAIASMSSSTSSTSQPSLKSPPADPELKGLYFDDAKMLINSDKTSEDIKQLLKQSSYYNLKDDKDINPYLVDFLKNIDNKALKAKSTSMGDVQGGLTGLLNPTTAIDALGTFIANRFRQEVTITYLDHLRTWLDGSLVNERVLFPASYLVLAQSDPFQYTTFLNSLREGFAEDLNQLPPHTISYLDANKNLLYNPDVRLSLKATLHVVDQVRLNADPLVIVRQLDSQSWLTSEDKDKGLTKGLLLLAVFTRGASRLKDAENLTLLSAKDLNALTDKSLANAFLGLWLLGEKEKLNNIRISSSQTMYDFLADKVNADHVSKLLDYLKTLIDQFETIKSLREQGLKPFQEDNSLRLKQPEEFQEVYFQYIEAIRTLVEKGVLQVPFVNFTTQQTNVFNQFFSSSKQLVQVTKYVSQKRYGLALSGTVAVLLPYLSNDPAQRKAVLYMAIVDELNKQQKAGIALAEGSTVSIMESEIGKWVGSNLTHKTVFATIKADIEKKVGIQADWLNQLMKYGNFMVTVVNAKTSEEMAAALDAAALPVGSYRIKRNSQFSISLNAYGGLYGGGSFGTTYQTTESTNTVLTPTSTAMRGGFIFGPSAPIGITLGWGCGRGEKRKDGRFWGFSLPLLDVGGIFAFRLLDGKTQLPELSWRNVFTPGLYIVHAPKWLPALAISGGIQYGPELRGIALDTDQKTKAEFNVQSWRIGATLTVDIPIFNLYSRYDN